MSGKRSRDKGMRYQRAVRNHFSESGFDVFDPNRSGYDGDDMRVNEVPYISIELKDHATMALSTWVAQAAQQAGEGEVPVVIHKKKGTTDVNQHYVTMTVESFISLLDKLKGENN